MIFAVDLDGTLLTSDKKLLPENIAAIKKAQEKGHLVIPITGRSFKGVQEIIKQLDVKKYVVVNNGASIYNVKTKTMHSFTPIGSDVILDLLGISKDEGAQFSIHAEKETIRCSFTTKKIVKNKNDWATMVSQKELKKRIPTIKAMQISMRSTADVIDKWHHILQEKYYSKYQINKTSNIYLDVNFKHVSKYEALEWIIKKDNLKDDIIAFGDSDNDIHMIIGAKLGIAMANATELVISRCDEVIGSNDTPSIAKKILELI